MLADAVAARRALCLATASARAEQGGRLGGGAAEVGGERGGLLAGAAAEAAAGEEDEEEWVEEEEVGSITLRLEQLPVACSLGGKLWDASLLLSAWVAEHTHLFLPAAPAAASAASASSASASGTCRAGGRAFPSAPVASHAAP